MICLSIMVKKMLNRVGARTQPCFTPLTMGKDLKRSLFNLTWLRWSLCSWITMLRNFEDSQGAPSSYTVPFCSLCQTLWSGPQKLHRVLCYAPCISLGAVWGRTPCLWCPCWLWTHIGFLVNGLQRWWVPICLGAHVYPAPNNRQGIRGAYCVMLILHLSSCIATPQLRYGFGNFFHRG